MTRLNRLIIVSACLLSTVGVQAVEPADAEALRTALKAKDAAFDDALLRYTTWGEIGIKGFQAWKYPPNYAAEKLGIKEYGPQRVKFRYHEQMVVRDRDTTFTREADRELKHDGGWSPLRSRSGARSAMFSAKSVKWEIPRLLNGFTTSASGKNPASSPNSE